MSNALADCAVVVADQDVFSCELAGGQALLDLRSSTYYSVNSVGSHVWGLLKRPIAVAEIRRSVTDTFDVEEARAAADIQALLQQFADAGLVQVENEKSA